MIIRVLLASHMSILQGDSEGEDDDDDMDDDALSDWNLRKYRSSLW